MVLRKYFPGTLNAALSSLLAKTIVKFVDLLSHVYPKLLAKSKKATSSLLGNIYSVYTFSLHGWQSCFSVEKSGITQVH